MHADNVRFTGDAVAALLDYDQVAWDACVVDLADALVGFASAPIPAVGWGVLQGPLDTGRAARLLAAYAALSPLLPMEVAALPTRLEALWLEGELGRVKATSEGAPEYHHSVLEQGRALVSWMVEQREQLLTCWKAIPCRREVAPAGAAVERPAPWIWGGVSPVTHEMQGKW